MADVRLIDAACLKRELEENRDDALRDGKSSLYVDAMSTAIHILNCTPTIDPESLRPQWISTEDGFPEYEKPVLVFATVCGGFVTIATLEHDLVYKNNSSKDTWWLYMDDEGHQIDKEEVTHWMPLPEPPEVSK